MEEAGPSGSLDPVHGVPQEEVAGGGVGLGRSVAVGRLVQVCRFGRRGAPALRDRAAAGGRGWMGWDGARPPSLEVRLQPQRLSGAVVETSTRCLRRCRKTSSFPSLAKV